MPQGLRWITAIILGTGFLLSILWRGSAEEPPEDSELRYIALGDSITVTRDDGGNYVTRYAAFLNADLGVRVSLTNLGMSGWTSAQLLDAVQHKERYREGIAGAAVVTVFIGMNDVLQPTANYGNGTCGGPDGQDCMRDAVPRFRANLRALLDEIAQLNDNPDLILRLCDIYYPTFGDPTVLRPYLRQMNEAIQSEADQRGLPVAHVFAAFNGEDGTLDADARGLLLDGVHPSGAGIDEIAAALRETGYAPLVGAVAPGDANCDGTVTAKDAVTILQLSAGVIDTIACEDAADANFDGSVTAVDSMVVLQFVARLVRTLPPP